MRIKKWIEAHPARAGTLAGWYQQACGVLAALVVVPLVIKGLPESEAGLWFSFQGLLIFVNLADFGLSFVVARQLSFSLHARPGEAPGKTDFIATRAGWDGVSDTYSASRKIFHWVAFTGLLLMVIIFHVIVPLGKLLPNPSAGVTFAWYLLGMSTLISLLAKPHIALLESLAKLYLTRFAVGTCQLFTGAAVIGVLFAGGALWHMAAAVFAVSVVQYVWLRLMARSIAAGRLVRVGSLPAGMLKSCFRVGVPMVLNISAFLVSYVQVPLLGMLLGPESVAGFYLAQRIGQMATLAVMQFVYPQLPLFTQEFSGGSRIGAARRIRRIVGVVMVVGLTVQLGFYLVSPLVVELWIGPDRYIGKDVLLLMALDYFVMSAAVVWAQFVLAAGTNPFVLSTFISGVINVALLCWGVPRFGLLAVPLSSMAAGLCTNYWFNLLKGLRLYRSLSTP